MAQRAQEQPWRTYTSGSNASAELLYAVSGTADDAAAFSAVASASPSDHQGLKRQSIQIEADWADTETGEGLWNATVRYGLPGRSEPEEGDSSFSFDTSGGTQHLTQSRRTVHRYSRPGETAPDFKGAIGVTHDSVEGVDVTVPLYAFSETHYKPDADVTLAYRGTLFALTGKVNDGAFKGLAAGECLFLGAAGSKRGTGLWEITYRFAGSPNVTGLMVDDIGPITKKGWEYLWVRYEDDEDAAAKRLVKRPVAAFIEKVYEEASFAGLGIG